MSANDVLHHNDPAVAAAIEVVVEVMDTEGMVNGVDPTQAIRVRAQQNGISIGHIAASPRERREALKAAWRWLLAKGVLEMRGGLLVRGDNFPETELPQEVTVLMPSSPFHVIFQPPEPVKR